MGFDVHPSSLLADGRDCFGAEQAFQLGESECRLTAQDEQRFMHSFSIAYEQSGRFFAILVAMAQESYFRRNWKLILNIVTLVALAVLIVAVHKQLIQTIENLGRVKLWVLLLLIPIELLNYHAQAKMYQGMFDVTGERLSYKYLYKLALELNFVNHVFPSGGVSGISYFSLRLRGDGVRTTKATLVQLMKLVLTFTSFEILLLIAMIILASVGKANNFIVLIGGSLTTLIIVGTIVATYIVGDRQRVQQFFRNSTRLLNQLIQIVRPKHPETISLDKARPVVDELHDNYVLFKQNLPALRAPFLHGLLANATEVAAVYIVYVAFGHWVNLGAVILAYAVANFAGLVSVLPGGVGVYETLMTLVLTAGGIPAALSFPATVMYRVLNTVLQLPPGYYLYHRNLRREGVEQGMYRD